MRSSRKHGSSRISRPGVRSAGGSDKARDDRAAFIGRLFGERSRRTVRCVGAGDLEALESAREGRPHRAREGRARDVLPPDAGAVQRRDSVAG